MSDDKNDFPLDINSLPNSRICKGKQIVTMHKQGYLVVECIHNQRGCPFGIIFGDGTFCTHPRRKEILERTRTLLNNSTGSPI